MGTLVDDKKRPGQHVVAATDATTATIDEFVRSDQHVSISDIVRHMGISRDSVHRIVHGHLKFRKVCVRWVPKQLMPDQQATRITTSVDYLQRCVGLDCTVMRRNLFLDFTFNFRRPSTTGLTVHNPNPRL